MDCIGKNGGNENIESTFLPGSSCLELMTLLANEMLKFQVYIMQKLYDFCRKKCEAFAKPLRNDSAIGFVSTMT